MGKKQKTKLQKHQSLYYIHGVTTDIVDINIIIRSNSMLRKHTEKRKKQQLCKYWRRARDIHQQSERERGEHAVGVGMRTPPRRPSTSHTLLKSCDSQRDTCYKSSECYQNIGRTLRTFGHVSVFENKHLQNQEFMLNTLSDCTLFKQLRWRSQPISC